MSSAEDIAKQCWQHGSKATSNENYDYAVEMFHKALGLRRDDAFSTTMLKSVVEQMINDDPPFAGDEDELPKLSLPSQMSFPALSTSVASAASSTATPGASGVLSDSSNIDVEMSDVTME